MSSFEPFPHDGPPDRPSGAWAMPDSGSDGQEASGWHAPEAGLDQGGPPPGAARVDAEGDGDRPTSTVAPPLPVPMRPMTISDLLDGGFAILKNRPGVVFGTCALIIVPFYALQAYASRNLVDNANLSVLFSDPTTPRARGAAGPSDADILGFYGVALLATIGVYFVGAVIARLVSAWYAGGDLSTGETLKAVAKASPAIVVAWLLISIANAAGWAGACVGWFFLNPLFLVTVPVIMIERVGPLAAIRRSVQLVARRYLWVVLYDAAATLMVYLASRAFTLIPEALSAVLPSPWGWIALGVGQTLIALVLTPPIAGVAVLVYLDLRIRTEGLDLELKAANAFAPAGAGAA